MGHIFRTVSLLLATLMMSTVVAAAADNNQFSVKGVGNFSCQRFVNDLKTPGSTNAFMYGGWVYGYLTGDNRYASDTFDLTPWEDLETLTGYLHRYCEQNPAHTFGVAVMTMAGALRGDRLEKPSPPIDLVTEHGKVRVYLATLLRAQKRLYDLGFYAGKPDGAYGPITRSAIEKFQKKRDLVVNGLLDQATLYALLRGK